MSNTTKPTVKPAESSITKFALVLLPYKLKLNTLALIDSDLCRAFARG